MCLPSTEPVTFIYEVEAQNEAMRLLLAQVDGSITLLDYETQDRILSLRLGPWTAPG